MKRIIMFVLLFAALKVAGQTTGYLRFDTVKIMKQNGTCELYIINKTKDSLGLLTNVGGGLTRFIKPKMLDGSTMVIGLDTLTIVGSGGISPSDTTNKWINDIRRSNDSVYAFKNGSWQFSYIDSTGGGPQTFPQTLAIGRTFAANDSVILANNIFKFKGGTLSTDSLTVNHIINLPFTRSADTGVVFVDGVRFMHNYQDRAGQPDGQNTFLGIQAGNFTMGPAGGAVQLGGRNVGIGYKALQSNTTGWQNTAVGHISLQKTTTGIYNTAVGAYTLVENTTGENNTGIGADALWLNTIGSDNTGTGSYVLQQNTTGTNNTALGSNTMMQNTSGGNNVAIGKAALKFNQVYSFNTAIGTESMENANIANATAVGARSLRENLAGGNTAVGTFAAQNNTTGADNTVVGYASKSNATTGNDNTGVGANSFASLSTGDGNTVMGQKAGQLTTTGNDNIFIGNNAGNNNTTGSRHIVISTDGEVPTGADDGSINIQNIIFGVGNTATGQSVSAGRIGIGMIVPTWGLHVQRSVGANKDSITIIPSIGSNSVLVQDTTNDKFQRMQASTFAASNVFPHTLDAQITTEGNTGTGETDLYTYTLPANKLAADGRTVNFEIDGEFNDNTATAQLKLYFGGNVTLNTGAVAISTAFTKWRLQGYIIRTSSSTAHVTYELQCPGLATPLFLSYNNLTSLDFTTTNIFKVTAQAGGGGGGTDDITAHSWQVLYKPAP